MKNRIILIGMMGSGKSTVSKLLSEKLGLKRFDLDEIFVNNQKSSIDDFFKNFGEAEFRKIETEILKETLKNDTFIISTGGGIILKEENRNLIFSQENETIYLKTSPEAIFERIKTDTSRPLLKVPDPKSEIKKIISDREDFYLKANTIIETDNKTPQLIIDEVIKLWKK